jgi:hypothetical protein
VVHLNLKKLIPKILALISLAACQKSLESRVIGNWANKNHRSHTLTLKGRSDEYVIDTVSLKFLNGSRIVFGDDTVDVKFRNEEYVYTTENYLKWKPGDEFFDLHILDVTDSTLTVEFFGGRDTVLLKRE